MNDSTLNSSALTRRPPSYFWAVVALTAVSVVGFFSQSNPTGINWGGAVFEAILLIGLASGSQLCRWFLLVTSLGGALVLLGNQMHGIAAGDVVLLVACTVQAALLCTPTMRAYTARSFPTP